jgi:malonyl-CoA/methylmalonyl-CoA synthetase
MSGQASHLPAGIAPDQVDLLAGGTLPAAAVAHWRAQPSRGFVRDLDGHWLTGAELDERTGAAATALRAAGARPGARFAVCARTSAAFLVAYVAALRAGLVVVPINADYTEPEIARIIDDARPVVAVAEGAEPRSWMKRASGSETVVTGIDLLELPPRGASPDPIDAAIPADPAVMLYTSGTTGRPKGAQLTHGNILSGANAVALAWRWTAEDRLLLTLPLFHMHGLGVGVGGTLATGAQLVLRPGFDAGDVVEQAGDGVTMFFGVPAIYQRLRAAGATGALRGLRLLVSGSAPLPAALSEQVAAATGQFPLERYGMTETLMITSNPYDGPRKPGKVGFPLPGVDLRLSGSGEIEVRGPNVLPGYYHRADADAEAFTADGWFRTGDLGELDDDGHLQLIGRSKELIITGGYNVYPREVEEVIATFPGVVEVAVIGRPSDAWGEAVTAVVVNDGPIDEGALRAHAATQLAPYKVPKTIELIDELPRNALGKVVRHEL